MKKIKLFLTSLLLSFLFLIPNTSKAGDSLSSKTSLPIHLLYGLTGEVGNYGIELGVRGGLSYKEKIQVGYFYQESFTKRYNFQGLYTKYVINPKNPVVRSGFTTKIGYENRKDFNFDVSFDNTLIFKLTRLTIGFGISHSLPNLQIGLSKIIF